MFIDHICNGCIEGYILFSLKEPETTHHKLRGFLPPEYLAAVGGSGGLKATKDEAGRDDEFDFEDSQPQFKLKNIKTMKFASVRSSVEVRVNQADATDSEFFQLEMNHDTKQVCAHTALSDLLHWIVREST